MREVKRRIGTAVASARRRAASPATRRRRWKQAEREIAARIGGQRVPVTGRGRGDAPDILHRWLVPEVKSWEALPQRVADALDQAERAALVVKLASGEVKLPVAIIHAAGQDYRRSLVVLRLGDAEEWFGFGAASSGERSA